MRVLLALAGGTTGYEGSGEREAWCGERERERGEERRWEEIETEESVQDSDAGRVRLEDREGKRGTAVGTIPVRRGVGSVSER